MMKMLAGGLLTTIIAAAFSEPAFSATASAQAAAPVFIDRTDEQNFEHIYDGGWEHYVGGGVATFDCNSDLFPDLFIAGGENPSKLLFNQSNQRGDIVRFEPLPGTATNMVGVIGAYPLDFDGDRLLDLFVLRVGEDIILRGLGDCRFERANEMFGFDGSDRWSTAFSATFEEGASLPTLAIGTYVNRDDPDGPFRACDDIRIYRPEGAKYSKPILLSPGYCALSMLFSDWGRTGLTDLRVSNDRHYYVRGGSEQLIRMDQEPRFLGPDDGWDNLSIWGMGIASRDISGDGLPDIFLTSMGDQKLLLSQGNADRPTYSAASYASGTTAHVPYTGNEGRPSSGWHAAFGDMDNDGLDDLFIAKGNVDQMPDAAIADPNNLLMQQLDGTFKEAGEKAGLSDPARSRGASVTDLNGDGLLDIVVVNRRANIGIYENAAPASGNYLKLRLQQSGDNSSAIGAWIELKTETRSSWREVTVGGGHASGQNGYHHFGLGEADQVAYRIHWPDGIVSSWFDAPGNTSVTIERSETNTSETVD